MYETHSITVDNERALATGWFDGTLSERGRRAARELGERRRGEDFALVFTSDLGRAVETANIAFAGSGLLVLHDPRPRECNYGEWNGIPAARLAAERIRHIAEPFPGGESYRQVVARMASFLSDLAQNWDGKRVLLIAHAAPRFAIDHLLNGTPLEWLVSAPTEWRAGWSYSLPSAWKWRYADSL